MNSKAVWRENQEQFPDGIYRIRILPSKIVRTVLVIAIKKQLLTLNHDYSVKKRDGTFKKKTVGKLMKFSTSTSTFCMT